MDLALDIPVWKWSPDPCENEHLIDKAFERARRQADSDGSIRSRGAPKCFILDTYSPLDGDNIPDQHELTFVAHADSDEVPCIVVNDGAPRCVLTPDFAIPEAGALEAGFIYRVANNAARGAWVVVLPSHAAGATV